MGIWAEDARAKNVALVWCWCGAGVITGEKVGVQKDWGAIGRNKTRGLSRAY